MIRRIVAFLIFSFILCLLPCSLCYPGTLDKVIVVVNGETITQSELDAAVALMAQRLSKEYQGEELEAKLEESRKEILSRMIDERLILSEAKKKGLKVKNSEIDEKLKEVRSQFESEDKFNEVLKEENLSLNELKQRYSDQIMVSGLIEAEVKQKSVVSPSEVLEYYNAHKEEFKEPEQIRLKNILIRPDASLSDEDARALAEKLLGFLKAGEKFEEVALKYSKGPNADQGGDLGLVPRGQMMNDIEDVIFNLDTGSVSEVIKTKLGYHIFKVEEKRPERIREFAEVQDQIEKRLGYEKGKKIYTQWIEGLKKNAYISYR